MLDDAEIRLVQKLVKGLPIKGNELSLAWRSFSFIVEAQGHTMDESFDELKVVVKDWLKSKH